jgi:hypothetical protein
LAVSNESAPAANTMAFMESPYIASHK